MPVTVFGSTNLLLAIVPNQPPLKFIPTVQELINDPRLYKIAGCESGYHQFDKHGKPLMSKTDDVGILQIHDNHWAQAKALGLDIFNSEADNIKMAKIVLAQQGYSAWTCSKLI